MPFVYYVSELEKDVPLDAERLLRLLGVSGKLSGFYFTVYMLEQVQKKPEYVLLITKRPYAGSTAIVTTEVEYWIGGGTPTGSVYATVIIDIYTGDVLSASIG